MARTKTKIKFFTIADYGEEERWLEEEHRNGWRLVKLIPPVFFIFEETKPEECVYQLDYKNKKITDDYLQMFEDYGWEYAGACLGWYYFRKPANEVGSDEDKKIFSDNESKIEMISHIFITRMIPLLILFVTVIIPNLIILSSSRNSFGKYLFGLNIVLFTIYLYIFIRVGGKLIHIQKDLKK